LDAKALSRRQADAPEQGADKVAEMGRNYIKTIA
jgi:hypothetical protein